MEQLKSRIEAVLFVTAKVLQINEIAEILGEEPDMVEEALLELIMDYASREGALEIDDENADFVVYNTCTVRENANKKLYGHLGHLKNLKKKIVMSFKLNERIFKEGSTVFTPIFGLNT